MSEKLWHLKNCRLFEQLAPDELRRIEIRSRARAFPRGTPIYLPIDDADSVFLLASGRARICHVTPDGKQSILAFIEPGELFGETAVFDAGKREEYAEAVDASTVVMIPREVIEDLVRRHPEVSVGIVKLVGLRLRRVERRLKNLLFVPSRQRLVHLLLELAEQYGKSASQGVRLGISLSHQELANVIGTTRETVTVLLGQMESEGLVRIARRKLVINDLDRLARSVHREAPPLPRVADRPAAAPRGSTIG